MATTGSSSSTAAPDIDRTTVDLVVGLVADARGGEPVGTKLGDLVSALSSLDPAVRWRLVLANAGASMGGLERVAAGIDPRGALAEVQYARQPSDSLDVPYHGIPGRARAVRAILEDARDRGARGCTIIDSRSAGWPSGLDALAQPLLAGELDFVAPVYDRHPFAGALVHGLVYPVFRALYGAQLRAPIAADIGCSPRLIDAVLPDPIWETATGQVGIDLWLATTAVATGFRVGQAAPISPPSERLGLDLGTTVSQVVGQLFADMERRATFWQRVRDSHPIPQVGTMTSSAAAPEIDAAAVADSFRLGSRELQEIWAEILPPVAILQWRRIAAAPLDTFRVADGLWARTVYDFAVGHRQRVIARDHLLRALTPLYLGWFASFVQEMRGAPLEAAEARIERLCLAFEADKPYLISQWRWPERFKPAKLRR